MIESVLIANRGEIAVRIATTLHRLGIRSIGIHTYADAESLHLDHVDARISIGASYLDITAVVEAALASGADAIHPGYGFLAENAEFARACEAAGLVFIGPDSEAIAAMGGKIAARAAALRAGVPVLPGATAATDADLLEAAVGVGFPLLIKPSAGGGGKGLHIAESIEQMSDLLPVARREALSSFGDEALLIERYLARPRHIEFQVLGDRSGEVIHLGERECTLQRRHQKVIEETPSPLLGASLREQMGAAAIALAKAIGYHNAGTVEFLVDAANPEHFYFIEMNTRLQVEHRVTELVYGIDLVELQIRIADGALIADLLRHPQARGHSIQARVYAEDPANAFLPTGGPVLLFEPARHALTDSAIRTGAYVSSSYDPMLAKVIVHAENRDEAVADLDTALSETVIFGLRTNVDYLRDLLHEPEFRSGDFDTGFIPAHPPQRKTPSDAVLSAYAHAHADVQSGSDGWRLNGEPLDDVPGYVHEERIMGSLSTPPPRLRLLADSDGVWVHDPQSATFQILRRNPSARSGALGAELAVAPMPGIVIAVNVEPGTMVREGDPLVVLEAMKMEHVLRATHAGVVETVWVEPGQRVDARAKLVQVVAHA